MHDPARPVAPITATFNGLSPYRLSRFLRVPVHLGTPLRLRARLSRVGAHCLVRMLLKGPRIKTQRLRLLSYSNRKHAKTSHFNQKLEPGLFACYPENPPIRVRYFICGAREHA